MSGIKFSPYIPNVEAWIDYFKEQPNEYKKFYIIGRPKQKGEDMNPIKLITPTEQVVEQARSQMKRENDNDTDYEDISKPRRKRKRNITKSSAKSKRHK
jgi:hypothetical protein